MRRVPQWCENGFALVNLCLDNGGFKRLANKMISCRSSFILPIMLPLIVFNPADPVITCVRRLPCFLIYIFKSSVLWVAYQKLQQICYVNIQVSNSHVENHEFVGILTSSPTPEQYRRCELHLRRCRNNCDYALLLQK
jgi:hypothetical protein